MLYCTIAYSDISTLVGYPNAITVRATKQFGDVLIVTVCGDLKFMNTGTYLPPKIFVLLFRAVLHIRVDAVLWFELAGWRETRISAALRATFEPKGKTMLVLSYHPTLGAVVQFFIPRDEL